MTKENITRKVQPCKGCGEPTPYEDGYCETCIPVEYGGAPKRQEPPEQENREA